jgi:cytochrome P450
MDASEYENPETFLPERFMNEDLDKPIKGHLAFGAGEPSHACTQSSYD